MVNIKNLETQYLRAKIEYYEGTPIMSDSEFDSLEKILKEAGSKVIEQVGTKRKDFDFAHPNKMLSLAKIQTEISKDGVTNYMEDEFHKWYEKRKAQIKVYTQLLSSPKFDGNAINIIYHGLLLNGVRTRGDGFSGKDITKRFTSKIPSELILDGLNVTDSDVIEIRCEVVINNQLFNEKYFGTLAEGKFANPRNYVAGVIGKDDYDEVKISELELIPVHYLLNSEQIEQKYFAKNSLYSKDWNTLFSPANYVDTIKSFEKLRETFNYPLDGVVLSFPVEYRKQLGQNDHDPEWSIAIKFVPEEVVTPYYGIEWSISKRGELTPVILLEPVQLAGTTVKRASGYNAGYIVKNKIGVGSLLSIAKAGDIIPEVQNVIIESDNDIVLPTICPYCQSSLEFDGIHLMCQNENCEGKIAKILASSCGILDLKGIGGKRIEPFAKDFKNIYEIWKWVLENKTSPHIEKYGIENGSRMHQIFTEAFENIKSISYEKVIQILGYENVGKKLSIQIAKEHAGLDPDYTGLEKALVAKLHEPEVESYIKEVVMNLESLGVKIDRPAEVKVSTNSFGICMTGSPKDFGFKTKADFIAQFPGIYEVSLTDANCKYLITDSYSSTSSKMKVAEKKGIIIKTYGDFKI